MNGMITATAVIHQNAFDAGRSIMYPFHIESFRDHFPPHFPVPALLFEFADWLRRKPWGSLGDFSVESCRWVDWGADAGDLYPYLAVFLRTGCGGLIAFWLPEGKALNSPPVVYLGSEGQLALLG